MSSCHSNLISLSRRLPHYRLGAVPRIHSNATSIRRLSSTTPLVTSEQEKALDDWISKTLITTRQYDDDLSPSKVKDLYSILPTRDHTDDSIFSSGKPLAPLHTLIFFHPRSREDQLGEDQTDREFCPPAPFTRRMWAGGAFRFPGPHGSGGALRIGQNASALVKIGKIEKKGFEKGTPMVFVHQNISYGHRDTRDPETLVSEERIHVYLPRKLRANNRGIREVSGLPKPQFTFSWTPTPTSLFRFSALTWNGHLIHLDPSYAREVEGYPERLVHGPLTALMLSEALFHEGYYGNINSFVYRAYNPVLVGRRQHLRGAFSEEKDSVTLWAEDDEGVVGMTARVDLVK
ncbi:hypothetical protein ACEPAI_4744 [Sanghuangporus weigelae]